MSDHPPPSPLPSQVGGHPGVLISEDGSLVFKPAGPVEHAFYNTVASDERLSQLRPHIPIFYGTLREGGIAGKGVSGYTDSPKDMYRSLVLENIVHSFRKPNIMDIKLGTVLYAEDADEAKKQRMILKAKMGTSLETGIRMTGFQVEILQLHDPSTGVSSRTPREYGRSLKPGDLPEAFTRFFPSGYFADKGLLLAAIDGLIAMIEAVKQDLATVEIQMVGSSLLAVWEGDEAALREGLAHRKANQGGNVDDEEGENGDASSDEGSDAPKKCSPAYGAKLIDFAHSGLTPGRGPPEGVLFGLDTTVKLLRRRRHELASNGSV